MLCRRYRKSWLKWGMASRTLTGLCQYCTAGVSLRAQAAPTLPCPVWTWPITPSPPMLLSGAAPVCASQCTHRSGYLRCLAGSAALSPARCKLVHLACRCWPWPWLCLAFALRHHVSCIMICFCPFALPRPFLPCHGPPQLALPCPAMPSEAGYTATVAQVQPQPGSLPRHSSSKGCL